jgi:hypothetical protein
MTRVINLWAGPGAGKSTTAAGLFFEMKHAGYKCELVTEYAKDLVYDGSLKHTQARDILNTQYIRQSRLYGKVDYIITDSPLLLSAIYSTEHNTIKSAHARFNKFNNINFFIHRVKPYASYGRAQTEQEARDLCVRIRRLLLLCDISHTSILGNRDAPTKILNILKHTHNTRLI